jgi:hypothetical protein
MTHMQTGAQEVIHHPQAKPFWQSILGNFMDCSGKRAGINVMLIINNCSDQEYSFSFCHAEFLSNHCSIFTSKLIMLLISTLFWQIFGFSFLGAHFHLFKDEHFVAPTAQELTQK